MKVLIEKALAKATGAAQSNLPESVTIKQAKEALQWALEAQVDEILGLLRNRSSQMWDDNFDTERCKGFDDAVDFVNDNFTE